MKFITLNRRVAAITAAIAIAAIFPVSAAVKDSEPADPAAIMSFSKCGIISTGISFSAEDFRLIGNNETSLDFITLTSLPPHETGNLMLGDQLLVVGDVITVSALNGIRFCPSITSETLNTSFTFTPVFASGESGQNVKVNLYLLNKENKAPTAENMEFITYKNVAYTGHFSAVDPEGDLITFQLVDKPARGSVTFSENGEAEFIYTPYENKVGKDSFTYIAIDSVGNISDEVTVKIQIEKPSTKVTYADMDGHPAHNAAIRLAEKKIYIGANLNGTYYFQPNTPLTRSEFLAMAMETLNMDELKGITTTGFYDDNAIQTWSKPYVASALKSGTVLGTISSDGQMVFSGNNLISQNEAAVLIDRMLSISDVSEKNWSGNTTMIPTWACQAVMNLETVGILHEVSELDASVTRAEAAQMLSSALDLIESREKNQAWFEW